MELKHDDGGGSYWRASVDRSYPRSTAATVIASTLHGFAFLYINCHSGGLSTSAVLSALESPSGWLLVGCGLSRMCRGIFDGKGHIPNDRDAVVGSSRAWPWRSSAGEPSAKRGDPTEGPRDVCSESDYRPDDHVLSPTKIGGGSPKSAGMILAASGHVRRSWHLPYEMMHKVTHSLER
jgi:hypothetical protein